MKKRIVLLCLTVLFLMFGAVAARPVAAGDITHVVQPGQTLSNIARWYGMDLWVLARANNIVNPNHIYVGQRLIIPAKPAPQPAAGVYVVKAGDTLYSIARRYGSTAWAIAQANGIHNLNHIYVGQRLTIPGAPPTSTPRPSGGASWRGEYFGTPDLTGAALFVRNDAAINFHWGVRSPDTRLNTDKFSVRWTRSISFLGGVYRLTMTVDDGARLWIDGKVVLDQWRVQPETTYEVDVVLSPGIHQFVIDYFDDAGTATAQFAFRRMGGAPATPTPGATPISSAPADAWSGEYFGNVQLSGSPVVTRMDAQIGFDWGQDSPASGIPENYFGVRWTRQASFYEDNYAFCAMADDGVRMYVDRIQIIDEWHGANGQSYCAEADLTKGMHEVMVEYYEDGGGALIYVWWERR